MTPLEDMLFAAREKHMRHTGNEPSMYFVYDGDMRLSLDAHSDGFQSTFCGKPVYTVAQYSFKGQVVAA